MRQREKMMHKDEVEYRGHGSRGWCKIGKERILLSMVSSFQAVEYQGKVETSMSKFFMSTALLPNIPGRLMLLQPYLSPLVLWKTTLLPLIPLPSVIFCPDTDMPP